MSYIERMGRMVALNQVYILIYSVLAAVIGVNIYLFLLVFLFIAISMVIQSFMTSSSLNEKSSYVSEVLSGKKLFHEDNTRTIQSKDQLIYVDLQEQARFSMYTTIGVLVGLAYFFALWKYVPELAAYLAFEFMGTSIDKLSLLYVRLLLFVAFFIYFEGYFIINQGIMMWSLSRIKKLPALTVPSSYMVTDKGIVVKGIITTKAIKFPLPSDVAVNMNKDRRFVEIVRDGKRTVTRLRLYTKNPEKLYDVLRRVAFPQERKLS